MDREIDCPNVCIWMHSKTYEFRKVKVIYYLKQENSFIQYMQMFENCIGSGKT
jgi:hypothetical protein